MIQKNKPGPFEDWSTFVRKGPAREFLFSGVNGWTVDVLKPTKPHWLCMFGPSGIGKTHLATEAFRYIRKQESGWVNPEAGNFNLRKFYWVDERDFASRLRQGEWSLLDDLSHAYLVFYDDLFVTRDRTGFLLDCIERLVNARVGKWSIWTSNHQPGEIAKMDARIASRLWRNNSRVIEMDENTIPDWSFEPQEGHGNG